MQLSNAVHPYLTWCFKGETKMKAVQRLWKSCLDANKHWAVAQVAALKNRHLQFFNTRSERKGRCKVVFVN
jgi:hypothetical protein